MASPSTRRTGSSRRAQYTTFFGFLAAFIGAGVGAGFLIISIADPAAFSWLRGAASDVVSPVSSIAARGRDGGSSVIDGIGGYFRAGSQNAALRRELAVAKTRLIEAKALAEENKRLKALLNIADANPAPVTTARLIGSTSSSTRRMATLHAGQRQGVTIGMPIVSTRGLIGRVVESAQFTARILLITDGESMVPVRRARDGVAAIAQGQSDGTLRLRLIDLGINPLKAGDTFVTSGSGGLFRPDVPVAVVTSTTRDGAIARVLSDPSNSEFVAVEPVWSEQLKPITAKPAPNNPVTDKPGTDKPSAATPAPPVPPVR